MSGSIYAAVVVVVLMYMNSFIAHAHNTISQNLILSMVALLYFDTMPKQLIGGLLVGRSSIN